LAKYFRENAENCIFINLVFAFICYVENTVKIKHISDIHLEFLREKFMDFDVPNNGADILILGGDILLADKAKKYIPWMEKICLQYTDVIYLSGNHESYGYSIDLTHNKLKEAFGHIKNLHILEQETVVINGVLFLGATLWSDANKVCPITKNHLQQCMNDYRIIRVAKDNYRKLRPQDTINIHCWTKEFIKGVLDKKEYDKVVLCTHHGVSHLSIHNNFKDDYYMNGGYVSDLSDFFLNYPEIKLAFHGHVHNSFDYAINQTRIITNPKGYGDENKDFFDIELLIEV
jgi:predicted MPP superfamily phosphohydrolase